MRKHLVIVWLVWLLLNISLSPVGLAESPVMRVAANEQQEKNPWFAFAFSLVVPGTGQMYVEERIWPEAMITAGLYLGLAAYLLVDQQRSLSIQERVIRGGIVQKLPDAHWDALTLAMQIALPALWIWNFGDAWRRAETYNQKVTKPLDPTENAYIMKESLISVRLWQF